MSEPPPCANCGNKLKQGALFCTKCGTKVAPKAETPAPAATSTQDLTKAESGECKNCHAKLRAGAVFCTKCGSKQTDDIKKDDGDKKDDASKSPAKAPERNTSLVMRPITASPGPTRAAAEKTPTTPPSKDRKDDGKRVSDQPKDDKEPAAPKNTSASLPIAAAGANLCSSCGAPLKPNGIFCTKCGSKQPSTTSSTPPKPAGLGASMGDIKKSATGAAPSPAPLRKEPTKEPVKDSPVSPRAPIKKDVAKDPAKDMAVSPRLTPVKKDASKDAKDSPIPSPRGPATKKEPAKEPTKEAPPPVASPRSPPPVKKEATKETPSRNATVATPPPRQTQEQDAQPPPPLLPAAGGAGASTDAAPGEVVRKRGDSLRRPSVGPPAPIAPVAASGGSAAPIPSNESPQGADAGARGRAGSLRRSTQPGTLTSSGNSPLGQSGTVAAPAAPDTDVLEERRARKGSFRESVVLSAGSIRGSRAGRESLMISASDREAALAKIDALLGTSAPQIVKIACMMDSRVRKTLEVEAIDGIINGRSIQTAWNLSPEQELHVTFVGLRAPNGEEIPFETSEEIPWPHIPFWEEVLFPDEVYEILYEDDRDVEVDQLNEKEVADLEAEFDAMDVDKAGFLTREGVTRFYRTQYTQHARDREGAVEKIMASNALSQSRKIRMGAALKLDQAAEEHIQFQVDQIMAMDVTGSGRVELHEYARARAADVMLKRQATKRQSMRGKRLSQRYSGSLMDGK